MYYPRGRNLSADGAASAASGSATAVHFHSISSDDSHPTIDRQPASSEGSVQSVHCQPNHHHHRAGGANAASSAASSSSRGGGGSDDIVSSSVGHQARIPNSSSAGMLRDSCASRVSGDDSSSSHRRQFSLTFSRSRPRYTSSKASNRDSSEDDDNEAGFEIDYLSESDVAIATPCSDSSSNYVGGVMTDCESMSGTGRSRHDSESLFNRSSGAGSLAEAFSSAGAAPDASVSIDQVIEDLPSAFEEDDSTRTTTELMGKVTNDPPTSRRSDDNHQKDNEPPPLPPRMSSSVSKTGMSYLAVEGTESKKDQQPSSPSNPAIPKIDLVDRVVDEILETEKNYVADLLETLRQYLDPTREAMRRNRLKLSEEQCADLFGNLEQIYSFNRKFSLVLENCRRDPVEICKCFVKYRSGFDCYTYYCTNYPKSATILTAVNAVSDFVKSRQEASNHGLPLASYLLKPVQRILKYHLLLQALLDHYPSTRRGYGIVKLALETMTGIARHINETKRRRELDDKFEEIKGDLTAGWGGGDLKGCGLLVLDGSFRVHGAKAMRSLFLFQKTLFVCKRKNERFEVKAVISCANLMIIESIPKEPLCFHILDYENPKNQFTVQTKSMEEKQKWSHHLKRLMLENHSTIIPVVKSEMLLETTTTHDKEVDYIRAARMKKRNPPLSRNLSNEERGPLRKSPSYQSAIELNHHPHHHHHNGYRPNPGFPSSASSSSKRIRKYRRKRRSRRSQGGGGSVGGGGIDPYVEDSMVKSNSLPNDSYLSKRNYADPQANPAIATKIRPSHSQLHCDSSDSEDSIINANFAASSSHNNNNNEDDSSSESDEDDDQIEGSSYSGSDYLSDDFMTAVSNVMPEQLKPDWPWSQHFQNSSNIALRDHLRQRPSLQRLSADSSTLPHAATAAAAGEAIPTIAKRLSWSPKTEDDSGISDQNSKGNENRGGKRDQRKGGRGGGGGGQSYASLFSPLPYRTPQLSSPSSNLFFNRKDMKSSAFHRQKSKEVAMPKRPVTIATDTIPTDSLDLHAAAAASLRYGDVGGGDGMMSSHLPRSPYQRYSDDPFTAAAAAAAVTKTHNDDASVITHFPSNGDRDFQTVTTPGYADAARVADAHLFVEGLYRGGNGQYTAVHSRNSREAQNSDRLAISLAKVCLQPGYPPEQSFMNGGAHREAVAAGPRGNVETVHHQRGRSGNNERRTNDVWDCRAMSGTANHVVLCGCHGTEKVFCTRNGGYVGVPEERTSGFAFVHDEDDNHRRIAFGGGAAAVRHQAQFYRPRVCDPPAHFFRPTSHPSRSKSLDPPSGEKAGVKRTNRLSFGNDRGGGGGGGRDDGGNIPSSASSHGNHDQAIRYRHKSESQPNFDYVTLIPESEMAKPYEFRNVYMVPTSMTTASHNVSQGKDPSSSSSGASWVTEMVSRFQRGLK